MRARLPVTSAAEPSPAQWALARLLDAAFDDADLAERCLERALRDANRVTVPDRVDDLLVFGRGHLVPILAEELGPRLAATLFEDLEHELVKLRKSDARVAPPRAFRRPSTAPRLTVPAVDRSPAIATEAPRSPLPTIQSPEPRDSLPADRPVLALVEGDGFARAPVARALVRAGFDVLPLDSPAAVLDFCHRESTRTRIHVVVVEIDGDVDAALAALRERDADLRVLAWTRARPESAADRLVRVGVSRFAVVSRTATAAQLVEAARRLLQG